MTRAHPASLRLFRTSPFTDSLPKSHPCPKASHCAARHRYHLFHLAMHQVMVVAPTKEAINKHFPDYGHIEMPAAEAAATDSKETDVKSRSKSTPTKEEKKKRSKKAD